MFRRAVAVGLPLAVVLACGSSASVECHVGADCASGACDSQGRCVPVQTKDASPVIEASTESGSEAGAPDVDAQAVDAGGCTPDGDGIVQRNEVPLQPGLHGTFRIAENVTVDTVGATQGDGSRTWDWSAMLSGDHDDIVTTDSPSGQWFSSQFPSSTYTTRLSDTQDLLGVFQIAQDGLRLQGVVSPTSGSQQTEDSYAPAAETLAFPMQMGTTWSTTSQVTGQTLGVPNVYTEQYDSKVDAHGTIKTPFGTFTVLRVQTTLTRTVGATVTIVRSFAFVAECAGPVATVTSQADEPNVEFTNAAEVRRLAP